MSKYAKVKFKEVVIPHVFIESNWIQPVRSEFIGMELPDKNEKGELVVMDYSKFLRGMNSEFQQIGGYCLSCLDFYTWIYFYNRLKEEKSPILLHYPTIVKDLGYTYGGTAKKRVTESIDRLLNTHIKFKTPLLEYVTKKQDRINSIIDMHLLYKKHLSNRIYLPDDVMEALGTISYIKCDMNIIYQLPKTIGMWLYLFLCGEMWKGRNINKYKVSSNHLWNLTADEDKNPSNWWRELKSGADALVELKVISGYEVTSEIGVRKRDIIFYR